MTKHLYQGIWFVNGFQQYGNTSFNTCSPLRRGKEAWPASCQGQSQPRDSCRPRCTHCSTDTWSTDTPCTPDSLHYRSLPLLLWCRCLKANKHGINQRSGPLTEGILNTEEALNPLSDTVVSRVDGSHLTAHALLIASLCMRACRI